MKTVLIVDDSAFMRYMLRRLLSENGFQIIGEATNGKAGVTQYRELHPDIVTMDVTMDVMNGIEALTKIVGADPTAKVVMVSSMGQEVIVRDAIIHGAKGFLLKPFDEKQVLDVLRKL